MHNPAVEPEDYMMPLSLVFPSRQPRYLVMSVVMAWLMLAFSVNAAAPDQNDQLAETAMVLNHATQTIGTNRGSVINDPERSQQQANSAAIASPSQSSSSLPVQADPNIIQAKLPDLNTPVIDQANLLTTSEREKLNQQILSIDQAGRAQIGLIILPSTGQEPIFDYATRAFSQWKLGNEKTDNGLLIVVAVNDHRIQILTGYGLEGVLPDVVLKRIIEEQITPQFKQNHYAQGLGAGLQKIDSILQLDPEIAKNSADQLKQQQAAQARQQAHAQSSLTMLVILCLGGMFAALFLGKSLSASLAGAIGIGWGLMSGLGLVGSVLLGGGVFFLLISSIAQLILSGLLRGGGGGFGGGRGGGGFGGGGYRGGGGSFGGGGASGSW